jgi:ERCC4-type nuclease
MNPSLKIDYREHGLLELLAKKPDLTVEICPLELGDIQLESESIKIVIERKTEADLYASIKDGRWREQKERMDKLREIDPSVHIVFLIEQIDTSKRMMLDGSLLQGALLNTIFRDRYQLLFTECLQHTAEYIEMLYKKVKGDEFGKQRGSSIQIEGGRLKKKLEKTDYPVLALSAIPRVSHDTAKKIVEQYRTLDKLIQGFKEKGKEMLADIPIGKKKLGKKLSSDIYEFLLTE